MGKGGGGGGLRRAITPDHGVPGKGNRGIIREFCQREGGVRAERHKGILCKQIKKTELQRLSSGRDLQGKFKGPA